jgi:HEAT repeat protein
MSISPQPGAQDPVAVYVSALTAPHWKTRWQAAQALGELEDSRAVEPLIQAMEDDNQWVRIVAAEALGQIRDQRATDYLLSSLSDHSIWVRRASVVALGQVGDARAVPALMERLLRSPDSEWPEELHGVIAKALGEIGEPAIKVLIDTLNDSDAWVSSAAARALGQIGDPQAITPLTVLIKQENRWVRSAATQALAQIADARAVRAALTTDEAPRAFWKLMALKEIDKSTIQQLTALLEDPNEHIRARAAEVLGQLGDKRDNAGALIAAFQAGPQPDLPRLQIRDELLQDDLDDGKLQKVLDTALQQVQDVALVQDSAGQRPAPQGKVELEIPENIKPLVDALKDSAAEVRLAAAEALGKIGDASIIPILNQVLSDDNSHVRAAAARSLGEIGFRLSR